MSESSFSDDELRDRIREVKRDEEQVSYERRMLHGRIDVVRSEILARIDRRTGVEESADDPLQDLVRRYPDYSPAYEALGGILLKQRKYQEAQAALEKAILLDPNSVKAHYQLGVLLGRIGRSQARGWP